MEHLDLYVREISFNKKRDGWNDSSYPFHLPIVNKLEELPLRKRVTFLVGENGTGKSTLMEALAVCCGFNPEGGSRNFNFSTKATHSSLSDYMRVVKGIKRPKDGYFLRAESFYNLASNIDDLESEVGNMLDPYGGKSLHVQSHGESFMSLMQNRFYGQGLYLLDEPEAALSPTRQLALISLIKELVDLNSQFIIATHSPILLGYPDAHIYELTADGIQLTEYGGKLRSG